MSRRGRFALAALLLNGCASLPSRDAASPGQTVHTPGAVVYDLKMDRLRYAFGVFPAVASLKPGDTLETGTVDSDGHAIEAAGIKPQGFNALTGPFAIEGAQPGDTLAIRFLDMKVEGDVGYGDIDPDYGGAIIANPYTPMLGPGVGKRSWTYPIDHGANMATFQAKDSKFAVKIPMHPFLGCVGVAPANGEMRSSVVPAEFGGNMDASEASAGNTLYLPVNVPGALLFLGDGHAAMGDGEIAGTAVEVNMRVRLRVDVIHHKTIRWPRFENDRYIMAAGIYRPMDDALRIAYTELVRWMGEDYGLSPMDAYELLSKTAEVHIAEMVDPNYVAIAKIDKKYLPRAK